jgi:hypothetical protein
VPVSRMEPGSTTRPWALLVRHFNRQIKRTGQADVLYDLPPRQY